MTGIEEQKDQKPKVDSQKPVRIPYSSPVLREYGSVSDLTMSGLGSATEGASGMGMA